MSSSTRIVLGLVVGLGAGAFLAFLNQPALSAVISYTDPVGTLWINALRMTVVPLVIALLITGIASAAETAATGRIAARALVVFAAFLVLAALAAIILVPAVLSLWPVRPEAAAAVRAGLSHAATAIPPPVPLGEWVTRIIPTNPIGAAAEGAMLPLVVFALLFGFAATRIEMKVRAPLLGFFQAVVETMLVLIGWVLWVAPVGVFALALGVGFRSGAGAAGAVGYYLVLMSAVGAGVMIVMYPVTMLLGRVSLVRFARAAAPAQVVAISTQSSLASLPAMLTSAQSELGISRRVAGIALPLAVSLFRMTSPPVNLAIVIFIAHVYGVHLGVTQLAAGMIVAVVTSLGLVSLPSQITFFTSTVPISFAMGVPTEMLSILIAVEVIPDIFRTLGNVTADLGATAIVARRSPGE
ncbi:MAG TPA: cation:dicarboxylase symporter family transporter [Steroidobacteraceae bacterium]|nr:cation:dicarboxylase symporter family transporter [Steroidobacteraceae bacterium]